MAALRRLVLVGLPGAGKSTVGPLVAAALGWRFVDLDDEIVRAAGQSIPEIFAAEGEPGFRARERAATAALAETDRFVLAPGGGWLEDPRNREALGAGSELVYLKVSAGVAAARIGADGGGRPLLAGGETGARIEELLRRRESLYLQANHTVSADSLRPDEVASIIVALATRGTGN